jgi:hypothetical protein
LNVDFEFVFRDLVTEPKQNRCPTQIPYLSLVCVVAAASWGPRLLVIIVYIQILYDIYCLMS